MTKSAKTRWRRGIVWLPGTKRVGGGRYQLLVRLGPLRAHIGHNATDSTSISLSSPLATRVDGVRHLQACPSTVSPVQTAKSCTVVRGVGEESSKEERGSLAERGRRTEEDPIGPINLALIWRWALKNQDADGFRKDDEEEKAIHCILCDNPVLVHHIGVIRSL
ncbi:hypothetical protein CPC08DRAFT_728073 [Agrocybe pediades]|nr:hypothetical protein CPC08DRAFT_728073 [Agrocybe pediades]